MTQRAKITSIHPQISPKVVGIGRIHEEKHCWWLDLKICRPQWLSRRQKEKSAEEIVTFTVNFSLFVVTFYKKNCSL